MSKNVRELEDTRNGGYFGTEILCFPEWCFRGSCGFSRCISGYVAVNLCAIGWRATIQYSIFILLLRRTSTSEMRPSSHRHLYTNSSHCLGQPSNTMSAPVEPLALESITALKQSVLEFLTTVDAVYATHPTATNGLTLLKSRALPILTFVQRLEVNIRFRDMQREREGFQDHTLAQFHAEQREAFESNNSKIILGCILAFWYVWS